MGKDRSETCLVQAVNCRIRMLRRIHDVGPIEHRGDARIHRAQRTEQIAKVDVVRTITRRDRLQDNPQVSEEIAFRDQASKLGLPSVAVRVDQAGHDQLGGGINNVGILRRQIATDGCNLLVSAGIFNGRPPQSIAELSEERYAKLKALLQLGFEI
jgi:hypothetical protein